MHVQPISPGVAAELDALRQLVAESFEQGGDAILAPSHPSELTQRIQTLIDNVDLASHPDLLDACGVVFGDAIRMVWKSQWVVSADQAVGAEPMLQMSGLNAFVNPVSMIVKRVESGQSFDVTALLISTIEQLKQMLDSGDYAVEAPEA